MIPKDRRQIFHFVLLVVMMTVISFMILAFPFEKVLQYILVVFMSSTYVVWGVLHHHKSQDLHPKVVIEYVVIALLGTSILITLLSK